MLRASTVAHRHQPVSLRGLLISSAFVGAATLTLHAGQASALQTPCSFGGNTEAPDCVVGPYQSTPASDKLLTLISTSQDGVTKGPTTGQGTIDFDHLPLNPTDSWATDLFEVDVDFDPDLVGPTSGEFKYKINIDPNIAPGWIFNTAQLEVDELIGNPQVRKNIYSDDSFSASALLKSITEQDGAVQLPRGYSTLFVQDTYNLAPGDVLGGFKNIYTQVPGPLPLLGAGTAFGFSRRLRQRVRQRHSLG